MRLTRSCYAVTGLAYSPPWSVNAGFIAGEEATLIVDSGANALAAATIHGYAKAVRPANRFMAVNTERHFDHILGNSFLIAQAVEVWGHPDIHRTASEFEAEVAEMNAAIPNAFRRDRREAEVFFQNVRLANPPHALTPDTAFELGGVRAEVVFTPGHTPTNVSVWVESEGVLYAGDCLINGYVANLEAGGPGDWLAWLDSLDRLHALRPGVVVCGHGAVAQGPSVERIFATVRRTIEEAIERGAPPSV